jgi:hypothetical protein
MNAELAQYVYPKRKADEVADDQGALLVPPKLCRDSPHTQYGSARCERPRRT